MNSTAAAVGVGCRPPFTASQWEELEHQALIFKYLIAGIPVPSELLLPIRRSYETMAARFYHHPAHCSAPAPSFCAANMGYCSYYGKKLDPEPGRCRRTDGKKWRCSKDAYPDSKYCERHMHRGRNRSRKHVETPQAISQPQSCCSTATSLAPSSAGSSGSGGSGRGGASTSIGGGSFSGGNLPPFPLHPIASPHPPVSGLGASASSHLSIDPASYGNIAAKDFRYVHGSKSELDERGFYSEVPGSVRTLGMDYTMDSSWGLMPSPVSGFPLSKNRDSSFHHGSYPQLQPMQDLGQVTISSLPKHHHQQQQHSFFRSDFGTAEPTIKTEQPLRPFFDEWPRARDSWSDLEDERSNRSSFSTTQLSMSIPMSSSDFSTTSSRSPNDD